MNKLHYFIYLLVCVLSCVSLNTSATANDTLIVITKPASPERLAYLKARRDSIENANCLAQYPESAENGRKVNRSKNGKNEGGYFSKSIFKVNEAIYGSHAGFISTYVNSYHQTFGGRLNRIQNNNRAYFKLIDNVMKRFSVPKEMKSLAVIESAMNCNAVSPVGAVGPWQFMEGTAKMMGLRVDGSADERRDFYKSTNAAARYLKKLHSMFHDWLLVIASYNCGPAPVLRAINSGNGRSFWDIKPKLPKETQNHVMAFIATTAFFDKFTAVLSMGAVPKGAKVTTKNASKMGLANTKTDDDTDVEDQQEIVVKSPYTAEELSNMAIIKVKGTYNLRTIAGILDEDVARLKRWNPNFDQDVVSAAAPIHLRLPIEKVEKFIIEKDRIISESAKAK